MRGPQKTNGRPVRLWRLGLLPKPPDGAPIPGCLSTRQPGCAPTRRIPVLVWKYDGWVKELVAAPMGRRKR